MNTDFDPFADFELLGNDSLPNLASEFDFDEDESDKEDKAPDEKNDTVTAQSGNNSTAGDAADENSTEKADAAANNIEAFEDMNNNDDISDFDSSFFGQENQFSESDKMEDKGYDQKNQHDDESYTQQYSVNEAEPDTELPDIQNNDSKLLFEDLPDNGSAAVSENADDISDQNKDVQNSLDIFMNSDDNDDSMSSLDLVDFDDINPVVEDVSVNDPDHIEINEPLYNLYVSVLKSSVHYFDEGSVDKLMRYCPADAEEFIEDISEWITSMPSIMSSFNISAASADIPFKNILLSRNAKDIVNKIYRNVWKKIILLNGENLHIRVIESISRQMVMQSVISFYVMHLG